MDSVKKEKNAVAQSWLDRWLNASILLLALSVLIFRLSWTEADPDLWGHVRFGQDVLRLGRLTEIDPYSYVNAGFKWINHEWLYETFMGFMFNQFGAFGLISIKLSVALVVLSIFYLCLKQHGFRMLHALIALSFAVTMMLPYLQTIRPQLSTYLFFTLTCLILKQSEGRKYGYLFFLPAIFAVWVNMHGGFLAGLAIFLAWSFAHLVLNYRQLNRKQFFLILAPILLSLASVLVNPYGYELIAFLLKTATTQRPEIVEWVPIKIGSVSGIFYLATVLITALSLIFSKVKASPPLLLIWLITVIAPVVASRHLPLFVIATFVLLPQQIANWSRQHDPTFAQSGYPSYSSKFKTILIVMFLGAFCFCVFKTITRGSIEIPPVYPQVAVELIKKANIRANIATAYNDGEYIIFHLGPKCKVSLDGRRETVYPDKVYLENLAFQEGIGQWDFLLTGYPTDLVLAGKDAAVFNLMRLYPNWHLVYEDNGYGLFAKAGSDQETKLLAAKKDLPARRKLFP